MNIIKSTVIKSAKSGSKSRSPAGRNWDTIEKLRKNNSNLKDEISLEEKNTHNNEIQLVSRLKFLQEEGSKWARKIEVENRRMTDLKREIDVTKNTIMDKKKMYQQTGDNSLVELQQKLKTLEHRHEKYMQKNNELYAIIQKTKEELKVARRERVIFDNVFKTLESDLKLKEEEIKRLILDSMQIEVDKKELEHLYKQTLQILEMEQKYFKKAYHNSIKAPSFISELEENEILDDSNQQQQQQQQPQEISEVLDSALDMTNFSQNQANQSIANAIANNNSDNKDINIENMLAQARKGLNEIEHQESQLEKLKTNAQVKDINEFIEIYNHQDENNEKLFKKSNKLGEEIAESEEMIKQIDLQIQQMEESMPLIQQMEQKHIETNEKEQALIQIQQIQESSDALDVENQQLQEDLNKIVELMPQALRDIGCELQQEQIQQDQQQQQCENPNYLGLFEQKVNEINAVYNQLQQPNKEFNGNGKLPFNYEKYKQKQNKLNAINEIIDNMEIYKEAEKLISPSEFNTFCKEEVNKYLNKQRKESKISN